MIDGIPFKKQACIKCNKDFINIYTQSGYRLVMPDIQQKEAYLATDISNEDLGISLREALNLSRLIDPDRQKDLYFYLYDQNRYKEWIEFVMKKFGYKTKSKMFKPMLSCGATVSKGNIILDPYYQRSLESWDDTGLTEADNVIIPETCTDEELGAAARLALSRCTSKFIDKDD